MRRVLLVGASGRVGRMVLHHWQHLAGCVQVMPQYRQPTAKMALVWDPLTGVAPLLTEVDQNGPFDVMIVLAGATPRAGVALDLNAKIAASCVDAAARAGIRRVLLASSSAVYGVGDGRAFSEAAACQPVNEYGMSKRDMEIACTAWRKDGMDLCHLRIGNVAGADALLVNIAKAGPQEPVEIDIFDDDRGPHRSYIGARTMAEVLQTLCLHRGALPAVLNIAAPTPISMDQLAEAAGHPWQRRRPSATAHQHIVLDCTALAKLHTFTPADSDPVEMVRQWKETLLS